MLRMTWWQAIAQSISAGRHGLEVSASIPMTTLPPATGSMPASVVGGGTVVAAAVVSVPSAVVVSLPLAVVSLLVPPSSPPQAAPIRPAVMAKAASSRPGLRRDGAFK
jgi:hypothetical protein